MLMITLLYSDSNVDFLTVVFIYNTCFGFLHFYRAAFHTVLHGMQPQSNDENSVCLSVIDCFAGQLCHSG